MLNDFTEKEINRLFILVKKFENIQRKEINFFGFPKKDVPIEKISTSMILSKFLNLDSKGSVYRNYVKRLMEINILYDTDNGLRMNIHNACFFLEENLRPYEQKIKDIKKLLERYKNPLTNQYDKVTKDMVQLVDNLRVGNW